MQSTAMSKTDNKRMVMVMVEENATKKAERIKGERGRETKKNDGTAWLLLTCPRVAMAPLPAAAQLYHEDGRHMANWLAH